MNTDIKGKILKSVIRIGTFITVSNTVLYVFEQLLPNNNLTKIGKIALFITEAVVAETVAYQATKFVDDAMDNTFAGTVIYGKEFLENS